MLDFRFDIGSNIRPREVLAKALLKDGPHAGMITLIELIEEIDLPGGCYTIDPAVTYAPASGKRYALYRWRAGR